MVNYWSYLQTMNSIDDRDTSSAASISVDRKSCWTCLWSTLLNKHTITNLGTSSYFRINLLNPPWDLHSDKAGHAASVFNVATHLVSHPCCTCTWQHVLPCSNIFPHSYIYTRFLLLCLVLLFCYFLNLICLCCWSCVKNSILHFGSACGRQSRLFTAGFMSFGCSQFFWKTILHIL